jgi:PAS domain S-box-containing protein
MENKEIRYALVRSLPQVFAGITICLAVLTLIGWLFNMHLLSGQWGSNIPMAPMTALVFLFQGFILFLYARSPAQSLYRSFSITAIAIISFFCLAVIFEFITGIKIGIEQLQSASPVLLNRIPVGIMSPLTALSFLLINIALFILTIAGKRKHTAAGALPFALIVITINFTVLVGYAFGASMMYSFKIIPTALPAAIAFWSEGICLFLMIIPTSPMLRSWNSRSFKGQLFRAFVPAIAVFVFLEAWLESKIEIVLPGNIVLFHAAVAVVFCSVMIIVIAWIAQRTGKSIEQSRLQIAYLAAIVQSSEDIIIGENLDGIITSWNKGAENTYGYKESEVIGKSVSILIPPGKENDMPEIIGKVRLGKHIVHYETVRCRKDGKEIQVSLTVSPIKNIDGKIVAASAIGHDITDRKRSELERQVIYDITRGITSSSNLDDLLKLIHESLRNVMYADNCFVALYDQNTKLFSFPYWVDKFDPMPEPAAMKKSCSAYVFRTGKPFLLTQVLYNQLLEQNEVELVGSDSPSWIGVPLKIPERTIGVLVLQHYDDANVYSEHDVDFLNSVGSHIALAIDRKKAEKEISILGQALKNINECVSITDTENNFIFINQSFLQTYGYIKSEVIGKKLDIVRSQNNLAELVEQISPGTSSGGWQGELLNRKKDGSEFNIHLSTKAIYDKDGNSLGQIGIASDITERKRIEQEILNLNAQLIKTNFEKDKFFSIIAHDLRSPFTGFITLTEIISQDISSFSTEELVKLTDDMSKSAQNLFNLLQNLLDWSQFQKGSISFTPQLLSLSGIVSKCIEQINQTVIQKGITIINEVSENQKIFADEIMINSVVSNLLSNSVKFTRRDGTVTISAKETKDQMIEISIKDSGIGMPKIVMDKLFMLGEKTSRKGTDGELSTGLGLLLCKEFIDKNGGRIWVDSDEGKGSTFYFTLPSKR